MGTTRVEGRKRVVKPAEERRRELLDGAAELFSTKGFDESAVQDIAEAAGVATGTVYLYFPSKEHVLLGLHQRFLAAMHDRFHGVFEEVGRRRGEGEHIGYEEIADAILDTMKDYCLEKRAELEVMARYIPRSEIASEALADERGFIEEMAESFWHGVEAGVMHTSDPEMAAYLLNAAVSTTFMNSIVYNDPPDLERLVAQAKELFHKALAPRP